MGEHVRVDPSELYTFALFLRNGVVPDFDEIASYVRAGQASDTSGFTGLLSILQQVVSDLGGRFSDVLDIGRDRMEGVAEGLIKVSHNYENTDAKHATAANNLANQLPAEE